jgi:hypothetical protein
MNRVFKKKYPIPLFRLRLGLVTCILIYKTADYEVGVSSKVQKKSQVGGGWVRDFEKKKKTKPQMSYICLYPI